MGRSMDLVFAAAALIIGVMLLTGHGGIFMRGGNADLRRKTYDEDKMAKGSGVALIGIGIATAVDMFTVSFAAKIGYIVILFVMCGVWLYYIRTKCRKQ